MIVYKHMTLLNQYPCVPLDNVVVRWDLMQVDYAEQNDHTHHLAGANTEMMQKVTGFKLNL